MLRYFREHSVKYGERMLLEISIIETALPGNPYLGRAVVDGQNPLLREVLIRRYKLTYVLDAEEPSIAYILRLKYGST